MYSRRFLIFQLLALAFGLAFWAGVFYVAAHFIRKYW